MHTSLFLPEIYVLKINFYRIQDFYLLLQKYIQECLSSDNIGRINIHTVDLPQYDLINKWLVNKQPQPIIYGLCHHTSLGKQKVLSCTGVQHLKKGSEWVDSTHVSISFFFFAGGSGDCSISDWFSLFTILRMFLVDLLASASITFKYMTRFPHSTGHATIKGSVSEQSARDGYILCRIPGHVISNISRERIKTPRSTVFSRRQ